MKKYKLVNENRAQEFINDLETNLNEQLEALAKAEERVRGVFFGNMPSRLNVSPLNWERIHKENKWIGTKKEKRWCYDAENIESIGTKEVFTVFKSTENVFHFFDTYSELCSKYEKLHDDTDRCKQDLDIIKRLQLEDSNEALNDYLRDDKLSFNEALFCILGLNPRVLIDIDIASLADFEKSGNNDRILLNKLSLTEEFRILSKAPKATGTYGFIFDSIVFTGKFINWSVEKDFLTEASTLNQEQKDGGNIEKYNQGYKKLAWFHNARIAINAYESLEPMPKTINTLFKDAKFYNSIKDELVLIADEGEQLNKIPSIGTVKNYIYHYNKFKKDYL